MSRAEELRYLVLAAQREGNRLLGARLRPLNLTPAQAEVLVLLNERKVLTLNGLGELLVCESGTNPSRLVGRLVTQGLVERTRSTTDGREVLLQLTSTGRRVAAQAAAAEEELHELLEVLATRHDVDATLSLLRDLIGNLPSGQAVARRFPR
ncbi:MAG: MarR family transcriptional regulator [Saccharothrix sp.]|nr:MarR family transcriptional regulator [Saccharothrix sp.]